MNQKKMKTVLKAAFSAGLRMALFPLHILPIKKNRILFTGLTGLTQGEYSCNPMYICEYLLKEKPGTYEILWAVSDPDQYRELENKGIRLVKHFSPASFPWLLTSKVIVSNGSYAPWFPFRKNQYFINTWHGGGAYKKIENDKPNANEATKRRAKTCGKNIKLFVSSCKKSTECIARGAFFYEGDVLEVGMPRNDRLVRRETEEAAKKVKAYYHMEKKEQILLYAPTYRNGQEKISLDAGKLLDTLERQGGRWRILYRPHRYQDVSKIEVLIEKERQDRLVYATDYPDMQELLCGAEILLTDYSSSIWDYSFLYRPCILYTPDLESYLKDTGFYVGIEEWPFPMAKTEEQLLVLLETYDLEEGRRRIEKHHRLLGSCETGRACEAVAERISEVCKEKKHETIF